MKTKNIRIASQIVGLLLLSGALAAPAATTYIKANNTTALPTSGSWTVAGAPGSGDIGKWDSTVTAANTVSLGAPYSIGEIMIANPGGDVSISDATAANILTLNGVSSVGLDETSTRNLTFATPLAIGGNQSWNLASGRTIRLSGANGIGFGANVVTLNGGTMNVNYNSTMTTLPTSSAGAGLVLNNSALALALVSATSSGQANPYFGANCALTLGGNNTMTITATATTGNHTQTFPTLTLNPGSDILTTGTRGSSSGVSIAFTAVNRNAGSMLDQAGFNGTAFGGSVELYGFPGASMVLGYATYQQNDWLLARGAPTGTLAATYTADDFTTAANNVNVTGNDSPATFTINSLRFNTAGAQTLTLSGVNTITTGGILVGFTVGANTTTITGGTLTSGNTTADSKHDLIVFNNNSASSSSIVAINSVIADNGATPVGLTVGTTQAVTPTGTVQLGAANTFSGTTYITKGTLTLLNSLALQNSTFDTTLPGTLVLTSVGGATTFGGLSGIGTLPLPANFALTLGNNNTTSTFNGAVTGAGATVTKTGGGTLTLNGANGYTGDTTISQGTLALGAAGSIGGLVSVSSGATFDVSAAGGYSLTKTLSGLGAVTGNLTDAVGGKITPGGDGVVGTNSFNNNLTLNGGTCYIDVDVGNSKNDQINVTGSLTLTSGTIQLNIFNGTLPNGTYKLIGCTGTPGGSAGAISVAGFNQSGQAASLSAVAGELDLVVSTYVSKNLVWQGDGSANLWDLATSANWTNGATPTVFHNTDFTTLDDSSVNQTVNLTGNLSPGSVTVNGTKNYTLSGSGKISGSAALTNNDSGTLTVLTTNDYSGGTKIASGATIQVGNGTTTGGRIGSGTVVDNSVLVFNLPGSSQSMGAASGSGSLTNAGAGMLVLNGADTLAGATTITAGTIKQGTPNVLPNGAGVGDTVVNGTLDMAGFNGTINGLTGSGIIDSMAAGAPILSVGGNNAAGNFSGVIKNTAGTLALNKVGSATLGLSATNTYSGGTTVTAGTIQLGNANGISSGNLNVMSSANLDLNTYSPVIDGLTGGGTIDSTTGGATLSIGNSGTGGTFSGIIQNSSGTINLIKNGVGTETLSGPNTYSGTTTCNAGTLAVTTGGAIAGTTLGGQGFLVNGGSLSASGTSTFGAANNAFLETSGTVNVAGTFQGNANDATLIAITGGSFTATAVSLQRTASFTTAPTAAAPIAASTTSGFYVNGVGATVSLGTLTVGTINSSASARVDAGTVSVSGEVLIGRTSNTRWNILEVTNGTFTASDTGAGIVIAQNNGANANNSELYLNGGTTTAGRIGFGTATDTVGGTGWLFVNGGATLYVDSGGIVQANTTGFVPNIELTSGTLSAVNDWSSPLNMNLNGTSFTIQSADSSGSPHNITLGGVLSQTAGSALVKTGGGKLTLSGANQYSGGTTISGGTLNINGIYALGGANYGGLTINGGSTLQYAPAFSGNGDGDVSVASGLTLVSGTDTIDVNGNTVTYANSIGNSGNGALTVQSTLPGGVLNLQAGNTYAGNTTVNGGTLSVNNTSGSATGAGNVLVASSGGLGGNGIITGAVEIQSGGILAPGNSVGTNTVGALTLDAGAIGKFEFNSSANDKTVATGTLTVNGGVFYLYNEGSTTPFTTPGTYNLIQGSPNPGLDSSWTTTSGSNPHIANPQVSSFYSFGYSGGNLQLTIVPNPAALTSTWTNNMDGNWSAGTNWSSNPNVPGVAGNTATLGQSTALRTVNLNANESVGTLTFNNNNSFVIANLGKTLTLDNTGFGASLYVLGGTLNNIQTSVALNDNMAISLSSGKALTVSGIISNSPSVTKPLTVSGAGTLALSGNNSYGPAAASGFGTTVSGGSTLQLGHNNALAAGDVSIAGNTTIKAGAPLSVGNNLDVASGVTVTVDNNGNDLTLGGNITDSGALTKNGDHTLTLNGVNTYNGITTVNGGVLSISASGNVQNTPTIILNGADLLGNGTFAASPNIGIGPTVGSVGTNALIDAASGTALTLSGIIASAGNTDTNALIVNSGAGNNGTVILANANTYRGSTTISNGLLQVANALALQNSTLDYNNYGGSLVFDPGTSAATLGGLTGVQDLALTNLGSGGVTLTVGNNNASTTYAGGMNDAGFGGAVTKIGSGTLDLTGINSYNGNTLINAGVLQLDSGGVIDCGAATVAVAGGAELIINGGTLVATNSSNVGSASLGLRVVSGSATYLGGLTTTLGSATGDFIGVTGGSLTAASLALGRTGLNYGAQPAAGDTGSGLYINGGDVNITGNLNMGITSAANSSVNVRMDSGSLTVGGAVTIGLNNGGRWSVVDVNGGTLTVNDTTTGISVGGPLAGDAELLIRNGTATVGIIGLGYGTVADTAVVNVTGGSLYLGSGGIVQVSPNVTPVITLNGGILGAAADWSCTNDMQLGSATIQAADASSVAHNISLSGTLSGANLTKTGAGTLTLSGVNTYNGPTTISEGVLALTNNAVTFVDGSIGSSTNITISSGAFLDVSGILNGTMPLHSSQVLSGNGTILGTLDTTAGGTVSPGGGIDGDPGILTVTNQVKLLGGKAWMKLNRDNSPNSDQIVSLSHSIIAGGTLLVTNIGAALQVGDTFQLFSTNVTGAFAVTNLPTYDPVNNLKYTWNNKLAINGTIKVLTVAPNVNTNPPPIIVSFNGTTLSLNWPTNSGWTLQAQTNNLSTGIYTNWVDVAGSTSITSTNITVDPTKPTVFYRLKL